MLGGQFSLDGNAHPFESVLFLYTAEKDKEWSPLNSEEFLSERYSTWNDAQKGHINLFIKWRDIL